MMIQEHLTNAAMWQKGDGTVSIDLVPYRVFCAHFFFENQAHDGNIPARQPLMMYIQELLQQIHGNVAGIFMLVEERVNVDRVDILVIGEALHRSEQDIENILNSTLRAICDNVNAKWFKPEENKITYDFHPIQSYEKYLWIKDAYLK